MWSSFSRLEKKSGIFQKKSGIFEKVPLKKHTEYTPYVLKNSGMFHQLKRLHCCDCFIFVALWGDFITSKSEYVSSSMVWFGVLLEALPSL